MAIFTIASWNYAHFAKTLAQSLREHEPNAERFLFLADKPRPGEAANRVAEFDHVVDFTQLEIENPESFVFRYDVMEFNTAIKPTAFLYLFDMGYDRVIYFDPDIMLFAPLDDVRKAFDGGSSTVLTPHGTRGNVSSAPPNDITSMQAGVYNLGFMALRNCRPALDTLKWWQTRLQTECVSNRVSEGLFVDQKFVDLWPAYCDGTFVLRHEGYNVAYWNLDHRELSGPIGSLTSNGEPLVFFHFSGINPSDRSKLSRHQQRWMLDRNPTLKALVDHYIDKVEVNDRKSFQTIPYGYGMFADGVAIPTVARWLYRETMRGTDGNPFDMAQAFMSATAPIRPNPGGVVTALAHRLWQSRQDLQLSFDLKTAGSQVAFAQWFVGEGAEAANIAVPFIDEVQRRLAAIGLAAGILPSMPRLFARRVYQTVLRLVPITRPLHRWVPVELRQRVLQLLRARAWATEVKVPKYSIENLKDGVSIVGYPFAETGVGEALRSLVRTSIAAGLPTDVFNFDIHVSSRQNDRTIARWVTNSLSHRTNVFCVNADMLSETLSALGVSVTAGRYNIVRPFWELSAIHPSWIPALNDVDEIWAPTRFVRDAFAKVTGRPVVHMPVAVDLPPDVSSQRGKFGLDEDRLLFMFAFDMASFSTRKNPLAVIRAFEEAFGDAPDRRVGLLVKTMGNGQAREDNLRMLKGAMHRDPRISLIDATLDRRDALDLVASCDVFVSLHRAEGFGLGIAEAMALGKAAIATDFSGSTDFLNEEVGYPVPYRLIDVAEGEYPYFVEGQRWADPDVAVAATIMRSMAENSDEMRRKGALAAQHMKRFHSSTAIAPVMRARLQEIWLEADAWGREGRQQQGL